MTSQGSALARFRRALATRNPTIATAAAHELGRLSLADALALCLVYAERDPQRFQRAAVRWHARLCLEARGMRAADAELALAAIRGLADGMAAPAAVALVGILSAHGLEREAAVVEEWLERRRG